MVLPPNQHGTPLPKAPWKAAGVTTTEAGKPKRSEEPEENPAPKQQKIAADNAMNGRSIRTCCVLSDRSASSFSGFRSIPRVPAREPLLGRLP